MNTNGFTIKKAITILARAWNNLDVSLIEPCLSEDVIYWSQQALTDMAGKKAVIEYLRDKMETIRNSPGRRIFAELGETKPYPMSQDPPEPCVILARGDKNNIEALILLKIESGKINSIAVCSNAPHPSTACRLGEYPD